MGDAQEREKLIDPMTRRCPFDAYYYGFEPTDILPIDRILAAVALAGKAYQHTDGWTDAAWGHTETYVEAIQRFADEAADAFREAAETRTQVDQVRFVWTDADGLEWNGDRARKMLPAGKGWTSAESARRALAKMPARVREGLTLCKRTRTTTWEVLHG